MNNKTNKKHLCFTNVMNEEDIQEMYQANEDFKIPQELEDAIKALADK